MTEVIVSLDVTNINEARRIVSVLCEKGKHPWFKVGHILLSRPGGINILNEIAAYGGFVFLDLKLYDTPNTIKNAILGYCINNIVDMMTITQLHSDDTRELMELNVRDTKFLAVRSLTTDEAGQMNPLITDLHGLVCNPNMVETNRSLNGTSKIIVTPGVRLPNDNSHEHQYVTGKCPSSDYIVVGRPIIQADDVWAKYNEYVKFAKGTENENT